MTFERFGLCIQDQQLQLVGRGIPDKFYPICRYVPGCYRQAEIELAKLTRDYTGLDEDTGRLLAESLKGRLGG